ncbi:glycoside hydrolase family 71 protein [Desarmillaria tabescens]|uniref:Glycoside hydrolase family 71 protein n=1 Tax=Armillaria tabescens TaxID=1929756 RepID=A0AA39N5H5_ARMTA|nr:glycoside hydrolase family 71 protein [Desarmillaria tabescens]KAK0458149.1 glycoside hydrolase family 71 protein [Desarmillaria tabescens]
MYRATIPTFFSIFFVTLFANTLFYGALASRKLSKRTSDSKTVVAHFIVGNSRSYNADDWTKDIQLAYDNGIDAFALNIGGDSWERDQVADAFGACSAMKTPFKLFFSFDMSSIPCSSAQDAETLHQYLTEYHSHGSYFLFDSKMLVSTFSGEHCLFGTKNLDQAWQFAVKHDFPEDIHFVPSFFVDPSQISGLQAIDGIFGWDSGWTKDGNDTTFDSDLNYVSNLGGKTYMAACSPWFFTHYGRDTYNKNWIYPSDDWLFAARWENLIINREKVDMVQILTWNDFGESHYLGPIEGSQSGSEAWTNGYDHQAWLKLGSYYARAFKDGRFSNFDYNGIYLWSRLYPAAANAPSDSVGIPDNWKLTKDVLWAVVFLKAPSTVSLICGSSNLFWQLSSGTWKLSLPLVENCQVQVQVSRDGSNVAEFKPDGFAFNMNPSSYNFNALVGYYSWN